MRVILTGLDGETIEQGVDRGQWSENGEGETLDLSDCVSLPGLADGHAHLAHDDMEHLVPGDPESIARRAFTAVEDGVFLVFDKGSCDTAVLTLANRPPPERPHLQAAGRMIAGPVGYFPGFAVEVDNDGLVEAVRQAAAESAGWVKLVGDWPQKGLGPVANFSESALTEAVEAVHAAGARLAIHTMAPDVASMAVRAGVDSIEHGLYLTDDDIRMLGARSGMWVPTVLRMEAVLDRFGPERTAGKVVAAGLDRVRSLLPDAPAAGVTVLAGTDLAVPSGRVAQEAVRLVEYGLTPSQAVAAVSTDAWAAADLVAGFQTGAPADLVAFRGDPREDISLLLSPTAVIRAGKVLRAP
jgi:imidazolonepropionase-like amidohydrolase